MEADWKEVVKVLDYEMWVLLVILIMQGKRD
jgi:hypothetical protein